MFNKEKCLPTNTSALAEKLLQQIGNKLYQARTLRRKTLQSAATSMGITHPVLSQVENGRYAGLQLKLFSSTIPER